VGQSVEDHQSRIDASVEVGAVQVDGAGERQIATAGDEQRRRQPAQIGEDRREYGIPRVGGNYIFRSWGPGPGGSRCPERPRKP
jgi:hypothetical protein